MKKKNQNWFQMQDSKNNTPKPPKTAKPENSDYIAVSKAPVLELRLTPKQEEQHYEQCLAFALKMSKGNSSEHFTVHMDMDAKLHFNMPQDEHFKNLWQRKELLCLIDLPMNWQTMAIDLDDEDADDFDLNDPNERFDYLYETGMHICEI